MQPQRLLGSIFLLFVIFAAISTASADAPWNAIHSGAAEVLVDEENERELQSTIGQSLNRWEHYTNSSGFIQDYPFVVTPAVTQVTDGVGTAQIPVMLTSVSGEMVSVDYWTYNGSALAGSHYTATSGTLVLLPGQITTNISVPINYDCIAGSPRDFHVQLGNPYGAVLTPANNQKVWINETRIIDFARVDFDDPTDEIIPVTTLFSSPGCSAISIQLDVAVGGEEDVELDPPYWVPASLAYGMENPTSLEEGDGCGSLVLYWDASSDIPTTTTLFNLRIVATLDCGTTTTVVGAGLRPTPAPTTIYELVQNNPSKANPSTFTINCSSTNAFDADYAASAPSLRSFSSNSSSNWLRTKYLALGDVLKYQEPFDELTINPKFPILDSKWFSRVTAQYRFAAGALDAKVIGYQTRDSTIMGQFVGAVWNFTRGGVGLTEGSEGYTQKYSTPTQMAVAALRGMTLYDASVHAGAINEAIGTIPDSDNHYIHELIGKRQEALYSASTDESGLVGTAPKKFLDARLVDVSPNRMIAPAKPANKFIAGIIAINLDQKRTDGILAKGGATGGQDTGERRIAGYFDHVIGNHNVVTVDSGDSQVKINTAIGTALNISLGRTSSSFLNHQMSLFNLKIVPFFHDAEGVPKDTKEDSKLVANINSLLVETQEDFANQSHPAFTKVPRESTVANVGRNANQDETTLIRLAGVDASAANFVVPESIATAMIADSVIIGDDDTKGGASVRHPIGTDHLTATVSLAVSRAGNSTGAVSPYHLLSNQVGLIDYPTGATHPRLTTYDPTNGSAATLYFDLASPTKERIVHGESPSLLTANIANTSNGINLTVVLNGQSISSPAYTIQWRLLPHGHRQTGEIPWSDLGSLPTNLASFVGEDGSPGKAGQVLEVRAFETRSIVNSQTPQLRIHTCAIQLP